MTNKFYPGAEVAVFSGPNTASFVSTRIVDKVYKNGNFILTGDRQQWSPRKGEPTAFKTGDRPLFSPRHRCELMTEELRQRINHDGQMRRQSVRVHNALDVLQKYRHRRWSSDQAVAIQMLASSLEKDFASHG